MAKRMGAGRRARRTTIGALRRRLRVRAGHNLPVLVTVAAPAHPLRWRRDTHRVDERPPFGRRRWRGSSSHSASDTHRVDERPPFGLGREGQDRHRGQEQPVWRDRPQPLALAGVAAELIDIFMPDMSGYRDGARYLA